MSVGLPVSLLINVQVNQAPPAAQFANLNSCLIMGDSNVIDTKQRIRSYSSLSQVATDFGTSAPEYLAAALFFGQTPQPTQLYIGRWAQSATAGINVGGILTPAQQLASAWTGITNGGIDFTIDGVARNLTGLDFHLVTNMNGVAAVISTALSTHGSCAWNGQQLIVTSSTTGASSTVAAATAGAGTDISAQTKLTASTQTYSVAGIVAESAVGAVVIMDNLSTNWFALTFATANNNADIMDSDHLAIAAYIEGANNPHMYGITTQEAAALSSTDTTSIGYLLKQLAYNRTFVQYSSSSAYAIASLIGRMITVNFNGNNTTITLMYKQEPGVAAENLTTSQFAALTANNYNFYTLFNNNTMIVVNGMVASGLFIDSVFNAFWLANYIQTNVYNLLYQSPTKIPQTDAGSNLIANQIEASCQAGVNNGYLAPGQWNSQGFGQLTMGGFLSKGYYVYYPPVASQSQADRSARKSVPFQVAVKEAGAVHDVNITVNVNR